MIRVSREGKRGCGYRKGGGLYLVADGLGMPCGKLPIPLDVCPTCHAGIKPSRGWTWVNGTAFAANQECKEGDCRHCPLGDPENRPVGRCGLLWIGEKFYSTPHDWAREANTQGISRRISAVPKDFKVGETWVLVAHRKCIANPDGTFTPGVFNVFKPARVEYVVKGDETEEQLEALAKRGIEPVRVERAGDEPDESDQSDGLFDEETLNAEA